jgi:hypothetical protein
MRYLKQRAGRACPTVWSLISELEKRCTRIYVVARKIDVERRVRQTRVILVCYASLLGKDEADIEFFTTSATLLTF